MPALDCRVREADACARRSSDADQDMHWISDGVGVRCATAFADAYPERPIRLIVSYPPGGGTDVTARTIVGRLSEGLGRQVVIDNRPGAGSTIGTDLVAKATPDGYTLLMSDTTFGIVPGLYGKLPYDALKDFLPVTQITGVPVALGGLSCAAGKFRQGTRCTGESQARRAQFRIGRNRHARAHGRRTAQARREHRYRAYPLQRRGARVHRSPGRAFPVDVSHAAVGGPAHQERPAASASR